MQEDISIILEYGRFFRGGIKDINCKVKYYNLGYVYKEVFVRILIEYFSNS